MNRTAFTTEARELLESLTPVDQAIILRLASDLSPLVRDAHGALTRLSRRRPGLLTSAQRAAFRDWNRRFQREAARMRANGPN
jgi:hypothetical protein